MFVLHPAAARSETSRGRRHSEPLSKTRNDFQRDRDRIVHSSAFRRLVYKTQVFLNHEGDLFRTRLTHSLEVSQLARSVARTLGLNEDLCESISLAHDLGHTPFGHAGQDTLDDVLKRRDPMSLGFEHNFQSLRVVDRLEERYPDFDGLNLTFETREGILKHCSRPRARLLEGVEPGGVGRRFLVAEQPGLEAQLCNLADGIAYNAHDIDDGVRSGLLDQDQLLEVPFFARHHQAALAASARLTGRRLLYETLRRMISDLVRDLIESSLVRLKERAPESIDAVRRGVPLMRFSDDLAIELQQVQTFLRSALYRHPRVMRNRNLARAAIETLFEAYLVDPSLLPAEHATRLPRVEAVTDYVAGMTDRLALREYQRIAGVSIDPEPQLPSLGDR